MKGLIKKDLLMIRGNFRFLVILLIVCIFLTIEGEEIALFLLPFMNIMLMMSTFSYDFYNKWHIYVSTLPKGKEKSVRAKYLATLLMMIATMLFTFILFVTVNYAKTQQVNMEEILSTILGMVLGIILVQSVMYPAIYKFGVEKARIGIFVFVFATAFIGGVLSNFIDFSSFFSAIEFINRYWLVITPIIIAILLYASYKVSEKIYKKKEF